MDILQTFGIQPILLAAQIVNFLVLLFLLNKFLYKPILKVLATRKDKIAQSLKDVEEIEKKLLKTEADRQKKLDEALKEAKEMMQDAQKSATSIIQEAHQKAADDMVNITLKARMELQQERDNLTLEIKEHLAELITVGVQKVASKTLTTKDQKSLVNQTIKDII